MVQNIFIIVMIVVAVAAVAFGWWLDRGSAGDRRDEEKNGDKPSESKESKK